MAFGSFISSHLPLMWTCPEALVLEVIHDWPDGKGYAWVGQPQTLQGLLTAANLVDGLRRFGSLAGICVGQIMTTPAPILRFTAAELSRADLQKSLNLMLKHSLWVLPVVDHQDCVIGGVTATALAEALTSEHSLAKLQETLAGSLITIQTPVLNENGSGAGIVHPVSEQHDAELELAASEALNRSIIQALPDMLIQINKEGLYRRVLTRGQVKDYYGPSMPLNLSIYKVLPEPIAQQRMSAIQQALATQRIQIYEQELIVKGHPQIEEVRIVPYTQDEVIAIVRDITPQKTLEIQLRDQATREQILGNISQRLRQTFNLEEILNTAVQEVRQLLECDRVLIYRFDQNRIGTIVAEAVSQPAYRLLGQEIEDKCLWSPPLYEAYTNGRISCIEDIETAPIAPCHADFLRRWQVRANMVVPILQDSQLWGLLIGHHCSQPKNWAGWVAAFLERIAQHIGIALQQAQMVQDLEVANAELRYQVDVRSGELLEIVSYEQLLRVINDQIRSSLKEAEVLEAAVRELSESLSLASCNIALFNPQADTYRVAYEWAQTIPSIQGAELFASPELTAQLHRGETVYYCLDHPLRGWITVLNAPIQDEQKLYGFLVLIRLPSAEFSQHEIFLARQVATQCAIGIRQAQLHQDVQQQVKDLTELNQLKEDFLHMVSHELRTPLTSMKMALTLLEAVGLNDRQRRYMQILKHEWQRELDLVNDLLDLQSLESGQRSLEISIVELGEWLQPLLEPFYLRCQERHITLNVNLSNPNFALATDAGLLTRVVSELLNNAVKYTPPQEQIGIDCRLRDNGTLELRVSNSGVEIPSEHLPRIFDKFHRVVALDRYNQGGTGLGLPLIKKAIQLMKGQIWVTSEPNLTRFEVEIPSQI